MPRKKKCNLCPAFDTLIGGGQGCYLGFQVGTFYEHGVDLRNHPSMVAVPTPLENCPKPKSLREVEQCIACDIKGSGSGRWSVDIDKLWKPID